jgi:hypothetical protein
MARGGFLSFIFSILCSISLFVVSKNSNDSHPGVMANRLDGKFLHDNHFHPRRDLISLDYMVSTNLLNSRIPQACLPHLNYRLKPLKPSLYPSLQYAAREYIHLTTGFYHHQIRL